MGLILLLDK